MLFRDFIRRTVKELKSEFPQGTRIKFELRVFPWENKADDRWEICVDFMGNSEDNMHKIEFEIEV